MPKEIKDKERFINLLPKAKEIRVVKRGTQAKLKIRTERLLYTFKTSLDEAEKLIEGVKVPVREL